MAVPKNKKSRSRKRHRMAHWKQMGTVTLVRCPNARCQHLYHPHRACPHCGQYRGVQVVRKRRRRSESS